jgi:hypothetical protein
VKRRPAEPNEHGKYALVEATDLVDTIGVRARTPTGGASPPGGSGAHFGEGWAASPRRNARPLGIRALTSYLTETDDEEENVSTEQEKRGQIEEAAEKAFDELDPLASWVTLRDTWVGGYIEATPPPPRRPPTPTARATPPASPRSPDTPGSG